MNKILLFIGIFGFMGLSGLFAQNTEAIKGNNDLMGSSSGIQVYPNPNQGLFYIQYDSRIYGKVSISIVNILGEDIKTYDIASNNAIIKQEIDIQDRHGGFYFIRINPQKGREIYKRIIFDKGT
jgi:hypothetical protein